MKGKKDKVQGYSLGFIWSFGKNWAVASKCRQEWETLDESKDQNSLSGSLESNYEHTLKINIQPTKTYTKYRKIYSRQRRSHRPNSYSVGNLNLPKYIIIHYQKATVVVLGHFWKLKKIASLTANLTQNGSSVPPPSGKIGLIDLNITAKLTRLKTGL